MVFYLLNISIFNDIESNVQFTPYLAQKLIPYIYTSLEL